MTLAFLQYLDYCKGRKILSNVDYSFPYTQLDIIQVIKDLENDKRELYQDVSIGIDEFHLIMPSGFVSGNKEDKELLINFLYQTRKLDIDVYYVTHRAMNINHKIRGMVELMLMARKFHTKDGSHCTFDNCKEEDHYIEVRNANDVDSWIEKEPIYINPSVVGKLYPTKQLLPIMKENYWKPKVDGRTKEGQEQKRRRERRIEERIDDDEEERIDDDEALAKTNAEIERLEKEIAEDEIQTEHEIQAEHEILKSEQEILKSEEVDKKFNQLSTKKSIFRRNYEQKNNKKEIKGDK